MKGADECPACGSGDTWSMVIRGEAEHRSCRACSTMWEPFRAKDIDESMHGQPDTSIFRAPCDNCAFRPGSPERSDPDQWANLMEMIEHGGYGSFYCHKGVPIGSDGEHLHPLRPDGSHDTGRMRLCAGFVAHRLGQIYKERTLA